MVIRAQVNELRINFDRGDVELIGIVEDVIPTEGSGDATVICDRCEAMIAREFDWHRVVEPYTERSSCGGTLLLGGLSEGHRDRPKDLQ
jgi:hypothetical protein